MAYSNTRLEVTADVTHLHWGAIWAGVFTFFAIWSVFGALCLAIFANSASLDLAMSVWGIVLTIIAMFFAGRTTSRLSGITVPGEGILQGMAMFGLAVTSTLFILVLGGAAFAGTSIATGLVYSSLLNLFSTYGWALFVALVLGWLAAMGGASSAHRALLHPAMQHEVRHA